MTRAIRFSAEVDDTPLSAAVVEHHSLLAEVEALRAANADLWSEVAYLRWRLEHSEQAARWATSHYYRPPSAMNTYGSLATTSSYSVPYVVGIADRTDNE